MEGGSSISRRTRSRWEAFYSSCSHKKIKKKPRDQDSNDTGESTEKFQDFETRDETCVEKEVRNPTTKDNSVGSDDSEKSGDDENADAGDSKQSGNDEDNADGSDENYELKTCKYLPKKGPGKVGRPPKKKSRLNGDFDFINMLLDNSGRRKTDLVRENPACVGENDVSEGILPLKFRFQDDEKSGLAEKTDWELEMDSLFDDLEMGLWESEVGCRNSPMSDDECSISTDIDESPAARCRRGEHDHVLDEQTGIVCRYCFAVLLDIKHVLPAYHVETPERSERKDVEGSRDSVLNNIQFQGSNSGNQESCIHSAETVFDLIPDAKKELYQHQLEGFGFLWRNIAGDIHIRKLEKLSAKGGRGCIISHAPGTGKTRLTIVFLQTFMNLYPNCRPVIIAPRGMLLTWEQEFRKWKVGINFHNLNELKLSDQENAIAASVADQTQGHQKDRDYIRFIKLLSWMRGGSILGIGYRLFEELAGEHEKKHDKFKKVLLELPGLLVLDEGHTPRNDQSLMWRALTKVTTRRRVILSGTPFQNNFSELYNTLCLVNPRFTHQMMSTSGRRKYGRKPGRNGKVNEAREEWAILTNSISEKTTSDDGLKKLRSMIEPFVHIHKGGILEKTLPGMRDCLIILKPTEFQNALLQNISKVDKFLEQAHLASLISVHPSLVAKKPEFSEHKRKLQSLKSDPNAGVKTRFIVSLIELSCRLHEKVLVFSEFIPPLLHVKNLLKSHFSWTEGGEVMYMDGDLSLNRRQSLINSFNEKNGRAKVMLASQRACCEGINLVGASRVVLLDVAWNPSVERQAISRAYRLGQEKMVHVYHLVTSAEVNKYTRQAEKQRISQLIFCPGPGGAAKTSPAADDYHDEALSQDKLLKAMLNSQQSVASMIDRIVHQPKES